MPTYLDEAIVLRTHKLGEADRIITVLSRHRGKIRAVAKGVRRTSSKFGARLEPLSHIDLQVPVTLQQQYSLVCREIEYEVITSAPHNH